MEKISSIEHIRLRPGLYLGVSQGIKSHPYLGYFSYGHVQPCHVWQTGQDAEMETLS